MFPFTPLLLFCIKSSISMTYILIILQLRNSGFLTPMEITCSNLYILGSTFLLLIRSFIIRLLFTLQEIQEALFPPSVHIYRKKVKTSQEHGVNGGVIRSNEDDNKGTSSAYVDIRGSQGRDNGRVTKSTNSSLEIKNGSRSSSPYPNVCFSLLLPHEY